MCLQDEESNENEIQIKYQSCGNLTEKYCYKSRTEELGEYFFSSLTLSFARDLNAWKRNNFESCHIFMNSFQLMYRQPLSYASFLSAILCLFEKYAFFVGT